jgi:hypothetical protein
MCRSRPFVFVAVAVSLSLAAMSGCATNAGDADVEESEADLSAAGKKLIGTWGAESGPLTVLVLTGERVGQQNRFFAEVDTGIRCVQAPCSAAQARIEGTFTAGTRTITLRAPLAPVELQETLGRYAYTRAGSRLKLTREGETDTLSRIDSYCASPSDCDVQGIAHASCTGQWSCGGEQICAWTCD